MSESGRSRSGSRTRSCIAGFSCSAYWKSSLTGGSNTFRNAISTLFPALGCLPRALSGKPRQASLPFWDNSEGHVQNLALGRIPSSETSDTIRSSTKPAKGCDGYDANLQRCPASQNLAGEYFTPEAIVRRVERQLSVFFLPLARTSH